MNNLDYPPNRSLEQNIRNGLCLFAPESKHFNAINLKSEAHWLPNEASFLCWYAGIRDKKYLILKRTLIDNLYQFQALIVDLIIDGLRYWRGPTWQF